MEFSDIELTDLALSDVPFNIAKDIDFYGLKYDKDAFKFTIKGAKCPFGLKKNTYNKLEVNVQTNPEFKTFIEELETHVKDTLLSQMDDIKTKEFNSMLRSYKEFPYYIKLNVDENSKYNPDTDFKGKKVNTTMTITGLYVNNKSYGLTCKLNKLTTG